MDVKNTIRNSLITMKQKKLRTLLTMCGIIIGISSVIIVTAIGKGQLSLISRKVKNITFNKFTINVNTHISPNNYKISNRTYLTENDIKYLSGNPNIEALSPWGIFWNGRMKISVKNTVLQSSNTIGIGFAGIGSGYLKLENIPLLAGSNFSDNCDRNFTIIDNRLSLKLFGKVNSLGKTVNFYFNDKKYNLTVIGIVENTQYLENKVENYERSTYMFFVPYKFYQKLNHEKNINFTIGRFIEELNYNTGRMILNQDLSRLKHTPEGVFAIEDFCTTTEGVMNSLKKMNNYVFLVAAVALLVGGIVVMNIMLVTVTERTSEIGLRKAIGAKNRDVMLQFLIEAVILTFSGGVIGIIIGIAGCYITEYLSLIPPIIDWNIVILSVLISIIIGVIFGLYPAYKAAKLNPIDALRKRR
jgi:putative ABC transport system permease protein